MITLLAAGCSMTESAIRSRAAHELHCSEDEIVLRERPDLTAHTYDVRACGTTARYTCARGYAFDFGVVCVREPMP